MNIKNMVLYIETYFIRKMLDHERFKFVNIAHNSKNAI